MIPRFSRWAALGVVAVAPALFGADGNGCNGQVPIGGDPRGGAGGKPGAQCKADWDCPVTAVCRLCPDGSCANPNVHCVEGTCSAPNYTCGGATPDAGAQCRSDTDCPVILLCKLCPDGSCADPNVHCVNGACSAPNYTCNNSTPCRSTQDCNSGERCTVEDGACNPPPGCKPGDACPAICYGVCEAACAAQDATGVGACDMFLGYKWDGKACTPTSGCSCSGADCGSLYRDETTCLAAHRGCTGPGPGCQTQQGAIQELLEKSSSCRSDAECTTVGVSCLPGGFCGAHYVNNSIDRVTLDRLSRDLNQCTNGDPNRGCPVCAALPPPAACVNGKCGAKPATP
ncbi:MAG TPA: hypothetical protein VK524_13910 [Polyangiaceae bacterium]|nr:hypothetical protein [Polyangiaceae bacterium]